MPSPPDGGQTYLQERDFEPFENEPGPYYHMSSATENVVIGRSERKCG